jgi:ferredoxin like protein
MGGENYLHLVQIIPDSVSHIRLRDRGRCHTCPEKPCRQICPSAVFVCTENGDVEIIWRRCLECGACEVACPRANIDFSYPKAGYGVTNHL